jgi:hypothetical protein
VDGASFHCSTKWAQLAWATGILNVAKKLFSAENLKGANLYLHIYFQGTNW